MKTTAKTQKSPIHRDALSAWRHLVNLGGLELTGRDADFEADLLAHLRPTETSLDSVLRQVSIDQFLQAFFATARPYVQMFEEILRFFQAAGATQGRQHWRLRLDQDTDLALDHFREQLGQWQSIKGRALLPALDVQGAWLIWHRLPHQGSRALNSSASSPNPLPEWIENWLKAYDAQQRLPLPAEQLKGALPAELQAIVPFVSAVADLEARLSYEGMKRILRDRGYHHGVVLVEEAALSALESDYWLGQTLKGLFEATHLPTVDRQGIEQDLKDLISSVPTCSVEMDVTVPILEDIVRLPIWQKRHELYAVWVATLIVSALGEHDLKLHHDNGRIEFAFRETLLASVLTSNPPVQLISERRSPLSKEASSTSRSKGAQPDYGIWVANNSTPDDCVLVVECKHYQQSAGGRFSEVLSDYALSLPRARVVLVSHGPIANPEDALSLRIRGRCASIGRLTADNSAAREVLEHHVRECVGPRAIAQPPAGARIWATQAMAVDISPSMRPFLGQARLREKLVQLVATRDVGIIVTIDKQIVRLFPPTPDGIDAARNSQGNDTELSAPVRLLTDCYESVLVVTDRDGYDTLAGNSGTRLDAGDPDLYLLDLSKRPSTSRKP
ncbi:MAG TPA: hypothetical protein VGN07_16010 [Steroidobacteraceae bacterium]|jgi:hypothetical protein